MNGYFQKSQRSLRRLSYALSLAIGLAGVLWLPHSARAQEVNTAERETLSWARIDYIRNRVQLVPRDQSGRRARISDVLSVGDSLRTARASRAELRFNDGSLARVGERAIFRFTPDTRNFQLSNGTILLLIPPGKGRSTIQTPNATTGIQGSALFVRYIPETDTTIVGALTNNPGGPMVLINRDGTESQALRANEIGVIRGDQITELYEFDGTLFWQSSGLAEGFNYLSDTASSSNPDQLDGVREEIREAISTQRRLNSDTLIINPDTFSAPGDETEIIEESETTAELEFRNSPAEEFLESNVETDEGSLDVGVENDLSSVGSDEGASEGDTESSQTSGQEVNDSEGNQSEGNQSEGTPTTSGTENRQSPGTDTSETPATGNNPEGTSPNESNNTEVPNGTLETTTEDITETSGTAGVGTTNTNPISPGEMGAGEIAPLEIPASNRIPASSGSSPEIGPDNSSVGNDGPSVSQADSGNFANTARTLDTPTPSARILNTRTAISPAAAAAVDVPVAADTTITIPEESVTVPDVEAPLGQPVPTALENLDNAQPIADMEMDDAMSMMEEME